MFVNCNKFVSGMSLTDLERFSSVQGFLFNLPVRGWGSFRSEVRGGLQLIDPKSNTNY